MLSQEVIDFRNEMENLRFSLGRKSYSGENNLLSPWYPFRKELKEAEDAIIKLVRIVDTKF